MTLTLPGLTYWSQAQKKEEGYLLAVKVNHKYIMLKIISKKI